MYVFVPRVVTGIGGGVNGYTQKLAESINETQTRSCLLLLSWPVHAHQEGAGNSACLQRPELIVPHLCRTGKKMATSFPLCSCLRIG